MTCRGAAMTATAHDATRARYYRPLLRLATAGSVDDGKSHPHRPPPARREAHPRATSSTRWHRGPAGDGRPDLASITDGLRAEREQGITIDVAYRYFATPRRSFIIADTPGHERYTRNMVTGASTAELAVMLIDARKGMRRAVAPPRLPGEPARHAVTWWPRVNKMDLVGWDEGRFRAIESEFLDLAAGSAWPSAGHPRLRPRGRQRGRAPAAAPWYDGPPLLAHLEEVDVAEEHHDRRVPLACAVGHPPAGGRVTTPGAGTPGRSPAAPCGRVTTWSCCPPGAAPRVTARRDLRRPARRRPRRR